MDVQSFAMPLIPGLITAKESLKCIGKMERFTYQRDEHKCLLLIALVASRPRRAPFNRRVSDVEGDSW